MNYTAIRTQLPQLIWGQILNGYQNSVIQPCAVIHKEAVIHR